MAGKRPQGRPEPTASVLSRNTDFAGDLCCELVSGYNGGISFEITGIERHLAARGARDGAISRPGVSMNETQTIFTIFFAISWGAMSNALPRWKPFHYAIIERSDCRPTQNRLALSFILFNVTPWLIFAFVMYLLRGPGIDQKGNTEWNLGFSFMTIVRAVLPGIAPYGLYRVWLAVVHCYPDQFYFANQAAVPEDIRVEQGQSPHEPTQYDLGIKNYGSQWDLIIGLVYVFVCLCAFIPSP
jgi:hypothetical protein